MSVVTNHQYEPPKLPAEWTGDEKKFYTRLIDILDEIYSKYGRLSLTDLSPAVRKVISGMVDGTTFETAIEQLQDSIALKASQSTVDALGQQVSSNTAAITLVPGQITSAVTAIQVGGRNLITNSEAITLAASTSHFAHKNLYSPLTNGQQYTITFGSVVQTAGSAPAYLTLNGYCSTDNTDFRAAKVQISSERKSYTFAVPDDGRAYTLILYHGVAGSAVAGNAFTLNKVKLEIGNKPTDWTPAPEDTEAEITATRSMITQTASEIRAEVSDIDSTLSGIDNLYSTGDSVSGYLTNVGSIAGGGTSLTETTSDYIAVTPGETLTFQCWVTPETGSSNYLWMAYGFFNSSKTWMSSPGRTAQTQGAGTGTAQYRYITFTVPAGAAYIRISGRMYADGRMKLEQNAEPTPYRDATAEIVNTSMTINRKGLFVNTSGIVGIDAVDSNNESYIYLGDILELDDQGGLKARVGNFTQSLKVGGKQVAALPYPVIFSRTTPTQTGVIWIQPTAAISAQFSSPSDTSRNSRLHFGYYGSTSASLPAFTFSAVGTDTVSGTGNKTYRLEFDIYSLTDLSSVTASFSATATKSGSTVNFGASSTYTLKKYQLEHITLTATSTTNLCSNTSAITVTIKATGSNLNKIFVQSNQTMLLNCAAAASSGQQACNLTFIP